jgi:activating signal cointegrator complex subunit 3
MCGRACRAGGGSGSGGAGADGDAARVVLLCAANRKEFLKKFLYEPFPVESSLLSVLADHLNAEIVASTISSKQEAMDYQTWTYFLRRLLVNPSYYELESLDHSQINVYLSQMIQKTLNELEESFCIQVDEDGSGLTATTLGRITSFYYLSHVTTRTFKQSLDSQVRCTL